MSQRPVRTIDMVQGDTLPQLIVTCRDREGRPLDLTGYSFSIEVDRPGDGDKLVRAGSIADPLGGKVIFAWQADDWIASEKPQPANIVMLDPENRKRTFRRLLFAVSLPTQ